MFVFHIIILNKEILIKTLSTLSMLKESNLITSIVLNFETYRTQ